MGGCTFSVAEGDVFRFAVHHQLSSEPPPRLWGQQEIGEWLDDTAEAWRTWSDLHQAYEGPGAGAGPPQRSGPLRPHLLPDRRHGRRPHHLAARDGGRRPQLGLPLRLGPRRQLHPPGAVGGGLPRRGQPLLRLRLGRRRLAGPPGPGAPDHVRHRGRTRPVRTRAPPPRGLAGQRAGPGRQRGLGPDPARRVRRAARRRARFPDQLAAASDGRPTASSSTWPTPPPAAGGSRTRGSGR